MNENGNNKNVKYNDNFDLVSIITCMYNCEEYIRDTILSVKMQDYKNWEMIIVDDKSLDKSVEKVKPFLYDKRIKLIKSKKNYGAAVSRNIAIEEAKGRFIAFLDSDDIWEKDKLSNQVKYMKNYNYSLTYTHYDIIDEKGKKTGKIISPPNRVNYKKMLRKNYIGTLTAMYDKSIIGKKYMPLIRKRQDYAMWLNILREVDYAYCVPIVLSSYRNRRGSISANKIRLILYNWRVFRKLEKLGRIKSCFYLLINICNKIFD